MGMFTTFNFHFFTIGQTPFPLSYWANDHDIEQKATPWLTQSWH